MNDYLVTYEFQFHKVRLKALRHFGYFFNFQFQFHKVRLKGY